MLNQFRGCATFLVCVNCVLSLFFGGERVKTWWKGWFGRYLGNSRAAVTTDCLNSFGIKHRLLLVKALIHVAYIALLCLQHAGQIDLVKIHTCCDHLSVQNLKKILAKARSPQIVLVTMTAIKIMATEQGIFSPSPRNTWTGNQDVSVFLQSFT